MVDTGISNTCMLWGTFFKDSSLHEGRGLQQLLMASCPDHTEHLLVYTPSWWKMIASRFIEYPVTRSCSRMRTCRSTGKTSTRQGWVWRTKSRVVSNKVRGSTSVCNEVYAKQQESQPSEFKAFLPWNWLATDLVWKSSTTALALSNTIQGMLAGSSSISTLHVSNIFL